MKTLHALVVALGMSLLGAGGAQAAGTHNLYIQDTFNDYASNSNLLLWSVTFDCNPQKYTVDYSYTPYPNSQLTIAFSGPFTDRPCTKYPFLDEGFYFTGTLRFSIENINAPYGVCTIPFAMGWGEPIYGIKRHYGKTIGSMACVARQGWYVVGQRDAYTWTVGPCPQCIPEVSN